MVTLSLTKESRIYNGETFLISGAGKTRYIKKNETRTLSYTIYKNKLKDLNVRTETIKSAENSLTEITARSSFTHLVE